MNITCQWDFVMGIRVYSGWTSQRHNDGVAIVSRIYRGASGVNALID